MVTPCVCVTHREEEIYEIKWPSLEPLSLICVINACRQPFGCLLSKAQKLFTLPKIIFMACLLHKAIKSS